MQGSHRRWLRWEYPRSPRAQALRCTAWNGSRRPDPSGPVRWQPPHRHAGSPWGSPQSWDCSNQPSGGAGIRDITGSVAKPSMHEQRVDHPQVDEDDRYCPPWGERDEGEVDHDRKARSEDAQQTRPGRSGKESETDREPDDSTDQVDPSPSSGARRNPIDLILQIGHTSDDASK